MILERHKKKDLLKLLNTMMEANSSVVKSLPAAPEDLADVFIQCQDAAIQIGTYLEKFEEEYRPLVEILEDYCEKIYQMSIATADENACRKISKKIRKQLTDLQNQIQYNMPDDRKEVVFLPYKASMWDSLESVWKAADQDEDTDAYVIPIPYYDKNPDGSFQEEHYEGDLYPEYVPITRYDEYDFEERRPDMIFIHNPYDNNNTVTSVHPFFYSGNLKKFTDQLIYIPYFILGEIDPDNEADVEGMKHFCITQGIINADKAIVQSENMKKIYVNVLTDFMKEHSGGDTRKYWEEKILGLGSPKMDKVLTTKKEDVSVPKEWRNVIEKEDGNWKKIIFYNTGLTALLRYGEKMLDKIEDVLEVFQKNQEEVALLWRPHPLFRATIVSVRPELEKRYDRIVEEYCRQGWGIYDDTVDLDRAIALSDGYYGDGSSIVQLYQETGQPIMYQNVDYLNKKNSSKFKFFLWSNGIFEVEKDSIWLVSFFYNFLCEYSLKTKKVKKIIGIPNNEKKHGSFYSLKKVKDELVLIPSRGTTIFFYHIIHETFSCIHFNECENRGEKFKICLKWKEWIYLFPISYSYILKINTDTKEVEYLEFDIISQLSKKDLPIFTSRYTQFNDKIYLPICNSNTIFEFNLSTETGKTINIGNVTNQYVTMCKLTNQEMILLDKYGKIILINMDDISTNRVSDISCYYDVKMKIWDSILMENSLFMIPESSEQEIKEFNIQTCELKKADFSDSICGDKIESGWWKYNTFSNISYLNSKIFMMNILEKCLYEISIDTGKVEQHFIEIDSQLEKIAQQIASFDLKKDGIIFEKNSTEINLDIFLKQMEKKNKIQKLLNFETGYLIFQKLKIGG